MSEKLILIGGPTASGKSAFAMQLARERNGNIINADAMQIYSGLPILTAQPEPEDKAAVPHLLYEVMPPGEASSAGKWLVMAREAITKTRAEGRLPILVGGTGLYFEALLGGLADIPPIPEDVRSRTIALYNEIGEQKFRRALAERDPEAAVRIAPNDRQRLIRACEVVEHTGKSLTEWQKDAYRAEESDDIERHLLMPPRDQLYAACDKRFLKMIERGAVDEVKKLLALGLSPALPSMKILGVREIAAYLHGEMAMTNAIAKGQQMTRNYAKRQMTWFRNRWPCITR